ncbi:MAG: tetratricopeptide repeat protein [Chloroflexi bacterium]|nr:tetratricopeptide repeat protein [Chloroflexota bacterium]
MSPRDVPDRQQTLRNTLDWSYDLLDPFEQALFRRLGVFVGGCTLEAAVAVCSSEGESEMRVLDTLASLVEKSLLQHEVDAGGDLRFAQLQTIGEYARDRLAACGEAQATQQCHALYYVTLADPLERAGRTSLMAALTPPPERAWLDGLHREHDNLRAALRHHLETRTVEAGLRLSLALGVFWTLRGYLTEQRRWLEAFLATTADVPAQLRAAALDRAGYLAHKQGDYTSARELHEAGVALWQEIGDVVRLQEALRSLAIDYWLTQEDERARVLLEDCLARARTVGDSAGIAACLQNLSHVARSQRDYARARSYL